MRRRNTFNKNREKKERLIMLGSAVFVLTALTMTGVYVKGTNEKEKNDGYTIDFSALENEAEKETELKNQTAKIEQQIVPSDITKDDFMDYIPSTEEGTLNAVAGETLDVGEEGLTASLETAENGEDSLTAQAEEVPEFAQAAEFSELDENGDSVATAGEAVANEIQPTLAFDEGDTLNWPIVGNVLINYSMDKTTYFATLEQYKYSPAIVIGATEGESIAAAANGKVVEIYEDEEIGTAVVMDLGNGYQLTYGQLKDIQVSEGAYVETGDVIGNVAAPTKYYSVEGSNVYFMLTKDGTHVNPMGKLN